MRLKIVVVDGSGLIGSKVVTKLGERGHDVVPASLDSGVNTLRAEGLAEALRGAPVVLTCRTRRGVRGWRPETGSSRSRVPTASRRRLSREQLRFSDLVRRSLYARPDPREMKAGPDDRCFGAARSERTLLRGGDAVLDTATFEDWLRVALTSTAPQGVSGLSRRS